MKTMEDSKIYASSYGSDFLHLQGLQREELDILRGALSGTCWVRVNDEGRLEQSPAFNTPPTPTEDPAIAPWWPTKDIPAVQLEMLRPKFKRDPEGIIVQSLCGYEYTPEKYAAQVELLESWGFDCLRSRRGPDGQFWEFWYLPGTWAAKGTLKETLDNLPRKKNQTEAAIDFLCHNSRFGELSVKIQRAAMTID
jgi:hypothetical protein